ncbi:MAG: trehalase family glycosidase [Fidelibacterota bacterium]
MQKTGIIAIITLFLISCSGQQGYTPKYQSDWQNVAQTIDTTWIHSKVDSTTWQMPGSLEIPLEYFSIHEHRNVLYGWDTYFTNAGLLLTEGYKIFAKNAVENQFAEIDQIGFVPNASEPWALNRAQIPYLSMMVREVYEAGLADKKWLLTAYEYLLRDYEFWTDTSKQAIEDHTTAVSGLQRFYHHATDEELITMYGNLCNRFDMPADIPDEQKIAFAEPWISEAESGMDFTPRFENRCHEFVAIDLNANLYKYEKNFAWIVKELELENQSDWEALAKKRRKRMNQYCWDEERGLFLDYDFVNQRHSKVASIATFYPMWAGLASDQQAKRIVENLPMFEYEYGPTICEKTDQERHYQWDYPAGWPPIYYLVAKGLDNYGYKKDAKRIAAKYLDLVAKNYNDPQPEIFTSGQKGEELRTLGYVYEKYDAVTGKIYDAEYPSRPFHGWSYGVFVWCLDYYQKN